jgi:hypothetical protein
MSRRAWGSVVGSLALVALAGAFYLASGPPRPPFASRSVAGPVSSSPPAGVESPGGSAGAPLAAAEASGEAAESGPEGVPGDTDFESALRWSLVDLESVREALPENLYWKMSSPSSDPELLAWREEERARWNREYGKVLSGIASDEEIADYFELRRRISEDAVEFSVYLSSHFGSVLPERDLGLLSLASRLHQARLEELPRREAEAIARKQELDRRREAWLRDEAAFGSVRAEGDAPGAVAERAD